MKRDVERALDECLALLQSGQATLDECLARYPQQAATLRPLLEMAIEVSLLPQPQSSQRAFSEGKQRMLAALSEKKRRQKASPSPSPFARYAEQIAALFGRKRDPSMRASRPVFRFALAVVPLLALLLVGVFAFQAWRGSVVTRTATLTGVNGVVEILPAGRTTWQPVVGDGVVETGDRIRTGQLATATLAFFDGSTTSLEAGTEVTISQLLSRRDGGGKVIVLHQWVGQTHNRVRRLLDPASRFEIETPTAITAVRGTEFVVQVAADATTQVVVLEGVVDVIAQNVVTEVPAGRMTIVQLNHSPSTPVPVLTPPVGMPSPTHVPEHTETPELTGTPVPTGTPEPTESPELTETPESTPESADETPELTETPESTDETPELTETPEPTEEAPELTETPESTPEPTEEAPEPTETPEATKTPEHTKTPEPTETPELTKTPEPTEEPPEPTETPEPSETPEQKTMTTAMIMVATVPVFPSELPFDLWASWNSTTVPKIILGAPFLA